MIRKFFSKDRIIALCNAFMKMKENDNFSVNLIVDILKKLPERMRVSEMFGFI